jgi:hypothetical protein
LTIKLFYTCLALFFPLGLSAQMNKSGLEKGMITDSVFCIANSSESYSLFLPDNYEESKYWPVLLILDPGAMGRTAIEEFIVAGRKYGYILACSNTVRNGDISIMLNKTDIMYRDVIKRFKIDERRIFTAGFSGGSRMALAYSIINKKVSGVIGCGAAIPGNNVLQRPQISHLIYFGIVGNKDMNYLEMNDFSQSLTNAGVLSYFKIFNGGHEWPSPQDLEFAVGWLELQMMKKGVIEKTENFLNDFILKMIAVAEESEGRSDLVSTVKYYSYILRDFPESPHNEALLAHLKIIEKSELYKKGLRNWEKSHDEEIMIREKYQKAFSEITKNNELPDSIVNWWNSEINYLKSKTGKSRSSDSLMAFRLLNMITIACVEYGTRFFTTANYTIATKFFRIWTLCEPGKIYCWYNLARAYAFDGQKYEAISALDKSIRNGFSNRETIMNDKAFSNILNEKRFKRVIMSIK